MNTYKVPDALEDAYKGTGLAFIATKGGAMIALRYLADVAPNASQEVEALQSVIESGVLAPVVRELQALGDVHIGMLSGWEFTEL